MAFYNAIFLDEGKQIVGRTHLTDTNLSKFLLCPTKWIVKHNGLRLNCNFRLEKILSGPHNLLQISKNQKPNLEKNVGKINVTVTTTFGKLIPLTLTPKTTVEEMKEMLEEVEQIPVDMQRILFYGRQLVYDEILVNSGVKDGDKLHLALRLRGGGGGSFKDLEGQRVTGRGEVVDPATAEKWTTCSLGLNVIGKCENRQCPTYGSRDDVILKQGMGYWNINGNLGLSDTPSCHCPACYSSTAFKPNNFVVVGARSVINFRKSGEYQVKSTYLESPGEFPEYVELASGNDDVEYGDIEVRTTGLHESPFYCFACMKYIMLRNSEVEQPCGHYFHSDCSKKFKDCPVCRADFLIEEAVEKLFKL